MICIRAVVVEIEVEGLEVFLKDWRRLPEGLNVAEEEEQTITGNLGFFPWTVEWMVGYWWNGQN